MPTPRPAPDGANLHVDAVVLGGGVTGLWTLDALIASGRSAVLLESHALGRGQTVQSQGIIHGGGKYALRGVRDLAAVDAIREMPSRWRDHLDGKRSPDLTAAEVLAPRCLLWDAQGGGLFAPLRRLLLPMVARSHLLATTPLPIPSADWPPLLRQHAASVYAMAEPVLDTGSLVAALAALHPEHILACDAATTRITRPPEERAMAAPTAPWPISIEVTSHVGDSSLQIETSTIVLAAGAGNESLLATAGLAAPTMQRRPLRMLLLRGALEPLYGHFVDGGKTRLTVTSALDRSRDDIVWTIGGQVAEELSGSEDDQVIYHRAIDELQHAFPHLSLEGLELASYCAVRAEASDPAHRRPSGIHLEAAASGVLVAWPTKLALAPLIADAVVAELDSAESARASSAAMDLAAAVTSWPRPSVAPYPWEEAEWRTVR